MSNADEVKRLEVEAENAKALNGILIKEIKAFLERCDEDRPKVYYTYGIFRDILRFKVNKND